MFFASHGASHISQHRKVFKTGEKFFFVKQQAVYSFERETERKKEKINNSRKERKREQEADAVREQLFITFISNYINLLVSETSHNIKSKLKS